LEAHLNRQYPHPLGGKIRVAKAAIDTGYKAHDCYAQIKKRPNWYAVKGRDGDRPLVGKPTLQEINHRGERIAKGINLYILGVDVAKSTLLNRCKIDLPGAKYLNLPQDVTRFWCEGFAGSEVLLKKHKNGKPYYTWYYDEKVRNEPLDWDVYAFCCAVLCGVHRETYRWDKLRKALTVATVEEDKAQESPEAKPPEPRRRKQRRRGGYLSEYGR
jgi:phage terminase large subunit GpA-like protein